MKHEKGKLPVRKNPRQSNPSPAIASASKPCLGLTKAARGISATKKSIWEACNYVNNEQGDELPDFDWS